MDMPMAFGPSVVKRSSYGRLPLGINAVLIPNPRMGCRTAFS
jgi:hypothetical protein